LHIEEITFGNPMKLLEVGLDDPTGNLWVSDLNNNRVLKFTPPFSNGMSASVVIGQTDFAHGSPNQGVDQPNGDTLSMPWGLAINTDGNLVVADTYNNRILTFSLPLGNL
jgi:sugar lactone lactonase YvrE